MNDDLLKVSLTQGKQFNKYQTKIKKSVNKSFDKSFKKGFKEGFVTSEQEMLVRPEHQDFVSVLKNQEEIIDSTKKINQKDLDELTALQEKYNDLMLQYTTIQTSIGDTSLANINRVSSSNPYLNKNILFTDGTICYVTNQGIAKPYPSTDVYNSIAGKNKCPKDLMKINISWSSQYINGSTIPTNPPLIVGSNMVAGQSCGFEGDNVYAAKLTNNPNSSFVGCYNDKPPSTNVNVIPVMNSSGKVNGFISGASSVYMGNNTYGSWAAFDQNPNTFWHSEVSSKTKYNDKTGLYEGSNAIGIVSVGTIKGEYLQINMPGVNTSSAQNITVNQYSLAPRLDSCCLTTRNPNSWYVIGWKNNQWYKVDRQQNQSFTNGTRKVYNVSNPGAYSAYILLVDKVGNDDQKTNRYCVQVAEWNLFMNSDAAFTNDQRAMIFNPNVISYTSFDKCQEFALNNGYQYFGMQDVQPDGKAACLVSNDIARTKIYGDASTQTTAIPIWSSNTAGSGATSCYVNADGRVIVNDASGKILWQSPGSPTDCGWAGYVNPDTIQGSYGGNCVGKPLNIDCGKPDKKKTYGTTGIVGNLNSILKNKAMSVSNKQASWVFNPMTEWKGGDPAYCCAKKVDYSYQCGGGPFKTGQISGGTNINFDCSNEVRNCVFFFSVQTDGNLVLYRGSEPSNNKGAIWSTATNGKQKSKNPDWVATKGKLGRSYLKVGETLGVDEWIGSDDGSLKLIMQKDGNLVLYTSEIKSGCKVIDNKKYGGGWVNAVYKLDSVGNPSTLGKLGFVDSDSNLKQYPDSMIGFTNDYQIYLNTDSPGNDISSIKASNEQECQTGCNNNNSCAGYVFNPPTSTCWLKSRNQFKKQPNQSSILGVRNPKLKGSTTCSSKIINVDTIQYDNYVKGNEMTPDTKCNISVMSQEDKIKFDNIKNELYLLGQDITIKMENLYNKDNKIYEKLNMNAEQFKKNLEKYKATNTKIREEINLQSNNNIEGMENYVSSENSKNLNFDDLKGMLNDADLRVLQENYSYIMWSILAVGLVTITVNTIKK